MASTSIQATAAALGLLSCVAGAAPQPYHCPESIAVTEQAAEIETPWRVVSDKGRPGHFLENVRFYAGDPQEMANLVPDQTRQTKLERKTTWRLAANAKQEYWLACVYQATTLLITQPLPATLESCELTEQLLPSGKVLKITGVICR